MKNTSNPIPVSEESIRKSFEQFVLDDNHPCIMAQTVFKQDQLDIHDYKSMQNQKSQKQVVKDIEKYISSYDFEDNNFQTFLAVFSEDEFPDELSFERGMWTFLFNLKKEDPEEWDEAVSNDVSSEKFSYSLCGKAFYVVGLHPNSSRKSRSAPYPALVFNLHNQFEKLREMGAYDQVRNRIRKRDKSLQGTINPMVKDFGKRSEAVQYSGREVSKDWKCPYHFDK